MIGGLFRMAVKAALFAFVANYLTKNKPGGAAGSRRTDTGPGPSV